MPQEIEVLDTTIQKTYVWIRDVMEDAGWDDRHKAYLALRAVLHTLRDRLTVDEGANLSAQLPMLVRGLFYEGWRPSEVPKRIRTKDEFLANVEANFPRTGDTVEPETMTRAVLRVLAANVTRGEIEDVAGMLPQGVREYLAA